MHSTIYPAGQNLIAAAPPTNIGACFTALHRAAGSVIRDICNVPEDVYLCLFVAQSIPITLSRRYSENPMKMFYTGTRSDSVLKPPR
ncbi:MAG: hypothetical protein P8P91_13960 [Pseudomonadales bacterium]|nr:hypothetical protein [Pseudomonadales bacterium]